MSKTIKIEDKVYQKLDEIRGKRETFSQVVERLLTIREGLAGIGTLLNLGHFQYRPESDVERDEAAPH